MATKIKVNIVPKYKVLTIRNTNLRVHVNTCVIERFNKLQNKWTVCRGSKTSKGYLWSGIDGKQYLHNRIVYLAFNPDWNIENVKDEIDHRDRNPLNNHIDNLRLATRGENSKNKTAQSNSKTGVKGISTQYNKKSDRWYWRIKVMAHGKCYTKYVKPDDNRGRPPDLLPPVSQEAIDIRNELLKKHHGEFANYD